MKKILVYYASIGTGHRIAAEAIAAALRERYPGHEVTLADAMSPYRERDPLYSDLLTIFSMVLIPRLYDWAWQTGSFAKIYERYTASAILHRKIVRLVKEHRPDLVVCTHGLPASVLAHQKLSGKLGVPLVATATDFIAHPYWPVKGIDEFVASGEEAKNRLVKRGMLEPHVHPFGIPIRPSFMEAFHNAEPRKQTDRPRLLLIAGSRRAGPYIGVWGKAAGILRVLASSAGDNNEHWSVILGRSTFLRKRFEARRYRSPNVELLGYTEDMPGLMATVKIVLTKPGGLVCAETLAAGKPLILLNHSAGQEAANARFLVEAGAAFLCEDGPSVVRQARQLLADESLYAAVQRKACELARPGSAFQIADLIHEMLE